MKILFQSRVDLYDPRGGDTLQMENTKKYIESADPSIKIDISTEIQEPNIKKYDIVHLFNLDWVCETYLQALWAKQHNKKIVLSAIHHSEKEVKKYEDEYLFDIRRLYNFFVKSQPLRDEWKNIYRSIFNSKKIYPTAIQLITGIRAQQKEIIEMADNVLVQTEQEAKDIRSDFHVKSFNYAKVVNGVDYELFANSKPDAFFKIMKSKYGVGLKGKKIILNVGRIEPRKNQLNLINAFNQLPQSLRDEYILVFIGGLTKRSWEYVYRFNKAIKASDKIYYIGVQSPEIVASAMATDGLYVHPSWFETTGLVILEAEAAGMRAVGSGSRIKEYLEDEALYCDPSSVESIKRAIIKGVSEGRVNANFRKKIGQNFNWKNTALQTIEVYKKLLAK